VRDDDLLDAYRLLELRPGATRAEVREAYRLLARVWHPDRFAGNPDLLARATTRQQELNDAYRRIIAALRAGEAAGAEDRQSSPPPPSRPEGDPAAQREHPPAGTVAPASAPSAGVGSWPRTPIRWLTASPLRVGAAMAGTAVLAVALMLVVAGIAGGRHVLRTEDGTTLRGTALAAGGGHGCVAAGERVACWGANDFGQAAGVPARGAGWPGPVWRAPLPDSVALLAAGLVHSCALLRDGSVHCWGGNFVGQLGDGGLHDRAEAAPVTLAGAAAVLGSLGRHTCALTAHGSLFCWGDDTEGQLGLGRPRAECALDRMRFPCAAQPERVGAEGQWQALAVGGGHTCALDRPGRLHCWGSNRYGQLGGAAPESCRGIDGAAPCRRRPAPVPGMGDVAGGVRAVAAGASHTCVLDGDGRASCWGLNTLGQAGSASGDVVHQPTAVATDLRFSRLVAGAYHTCGITAGGALHCWGSDVAGELRGRAGDRCRDGACTARPVRVVGSGVADAAAGFGLTCARRRDGVTRCWGSAGTGAERAAGAARSRPGSPGAVRRMAAAVRWRAAVVTGAFRRNVVEPLERAL
jgi:alpha-tubulin suppressor-like RCC1 family protein